MKNNTNMLSHLQGKPLTENQQGDSVTIAPQTFCYLKEIELKITKIQQKPNSG